jgi:hypothetical protein
MKPPKKGDKSKGGDKKKKQSPSVAALKVEGHHDKRAARNIALIREKLATALDDPQMREQIVRAMRTLINEEKS